MGLANGDSPDSPGKRLARLAFPVGGMALSWRCGHEEYHQRACSSAVEQPAFNRLVLGSNPSGRTAFLSTITGFRTSRMLNTCTMCRARKLRTSFNRNSLRKDGLQTICRECSAKRSHEYYQSHTEEHRKATRKRRAEKRQEFKRRIDEIKQRFGCRVCSESDVVCLEFHHIDPDGKDFDIAEAMAYEWAWERVFAEIRKCACLCANCHRKAHAGRFEVTEEMRCEV